MMTRLFYEIHDFHSNQTETAPCTPPSVWRQKGADYLARHPIFMSVLAVLGIPAGMLLAVGAAATCFGMVLLALI